jgi:hypothetical protein
MRKKFSRIKNLAPSGSQDRVTGLSVTSKTLEISFTTIEAKICSCNRKAKALKVTAELVAQGLCGRRTTQE